METFIIEILVVVVIEYFIDNNILIPYFPESYLDNILNFFFKSLVISLLSTEMHNIILILFPFSHGLLADVGTHIICPIQCSIITYYNF